MSDKKRKGSTAVDSRPSKKQDTRKAQDAGKSVKVSHVVSSDTCKPIIASSTGPNIPSDIKFRLYTKSAARGPKDVLLHSSEHPTIDYTAREGTAPVDSHTKHYVAVFDPSTNTMEVVETKKVTVRTAIRQAPSADTAEEERPLLPVTSYSSRAALTQAFGTKKSKKAVQSIAENRQLGQGVEGGSIADALVSNAGDDDNQVDGGLVGDTSRANKPLPRVDTTTEDIEAVYSLDALVVPSPASRTLSIMEPKDWISRLQGRKEITDLRSRFVANRISYIGRYLLDPSGTPPNADITRQIQLLRYIQLLVEVNSYTSKQSRNRPFAPPDKWPEGTIAAGTAPYVLGPLVNHFFPERTSTTHATTLLRTTILALTLHILPPSLRPGLNMLVTEPTDISLDMAMEAKEAKRLFRELGCKVEPPKERELERWGLEKTGKKAHKDDLAPKASFAKLSFPLVFPKISRGRPGQTRR